MSFHKSTVSKKDNVEIVQISADQNEDQALAWAKKSRFPFPVVLRDEQRGLLASKYSTGGIPGYVLVDKSGKVLATGSREVKQKIKSL